MESSFPEPSQPATAALLPLRNSAFTWVGYSLLMALLTIVFFADVRHHLLGLDDANMFADNLAFDRDFANFFNPAQERSLGSGRPFAELVKYLAFKVWGNDVAAYHLLVVGLHAACSLLVAYFAFRLAAPLDLSLLTGLLFLANATHCTAVHWISALDYPLATLLGLVATLCYIRSENGENKTWLLAFHVALLCGLLSHISIVFVAPFCLYWSWLHGRAVLAAALRLAPVALSAVLALAAAAHTTARSTTSQAALDHLDGAADLVVETVRIALWIIGRMLDTAHWLPIRLHEQYDWEIALGGAGLVALLFSIYTAHRLLNLWGAWTVLALLPFIPVVLVHTGIARYVYMATVGVSGLIAWALYSPCVWLARKHLVAGRVGCFAATALLLLSSRAAIERSEFVSIYSSAKYYLAHSDVATGARLMRQALAAGPETVDLIGGHTSLLTYLIGTNQPFEADLRNAQKDLPDDNSIRAIATAVGCLADDPNIVAQSRKTFQDLNAPLSAENREALWHVMKTTLRNLGHRATKAGDYALAIRAYQQVLLFDGEPAGTLIFLANAQLQAGATEDAQATARQILNGAAENEEAYLMLARTFKAQGDWQRALDLCIERLRVSSEPGFFFLASDLLWAQKEHRRALSYFAAFMGLVPPHPTYYLQWAAALQAIGRTQEAIVRLEEGLRLLPPHGEMLYQLGNLHVETGHNEQAVQSYAAAAHSMPDHAGLHFNWGTALKSLNRLDEAEKTYRRALQLDPQNASTRVNFAWMLHQRGEIDEAIGHYEQILRRAPHSIAQFKLALAYLETGRIDEAVQIYRRAVEQYGAAEAVEVGAVDDLLAVAASGVQSAAAHDILEMHWPSTARIAAGEE